MSSSSSSKSKSGSGHRRSSTFGLFDRRNSSPLASFSLRRSASSVTGSGSGGSNGAAARRFSNSTPASPAPVPGASSSSSSSSGFFSGGAKERSQRKERWRILARKVLGNVAEGDAEAATNGAGAAAGEDASKGRE